MAESARPMHVCPRCGNEFATALLMGQCCGTAYESVWEEKNRYRAALLEVERFCPCGARPESPATHPHVTGCPVGNALHPRPAEEQFDGDLHG